MTTDQQEIIGNGIVLLYVAIGFVTLGMTAKYAGVIAIFLAVFWPATWLVSLGYWLSL